MKTNSEQTDSKKRRAVLACQKMVIHIIAVIKLILQSSLQITFASSHRACSVKKWHKSHYRTTVLQEWTEGYLWKKSICGFQTRPKPSDFSGEKILSMPSFGEEVKPSVPCRKLRHVKEPKSDVEVATFGKTTGPFLAHNSTFRCQCSLASLQTWGTHGGGSWNVQITGPPSWGFDVPLATALCKNFPVENTQR